MFAKLLFLFIAMPMLELALLVKVGTLIGFWPTMGIVICTAILGASLARYQGFVTYVRIQQSLQQGAMPAEEMIDGVLILVGGIVLLTPGFITDIFGFILLIPFTRYWLKRWLRKKFDQMIQTGQTDVTYIIR